MRFKPFAAFSQIPCVGARGVKIISSAYKSEQASSVDYQSVREGMADARGGGAGTLHPRQDSKIFCGGLSWGTTAEKLEAYFSNFGQVRLPYDVQYSVSEAGVLAACIGEHCS